MYILGFESRRMKQRKGYVQRINIAQQQNTIKLDFHSDIKAINLLPASHRLLLLSLVPVSNLRFLGLVGATTHRL